LSQTIVPSVARVSAPSTTPPAKTAPQIVVPVLRNLGSAVGAPAAPVAEPVSRALRSDSSKSKPPSGRPSLRREGRGERASTAIKEDKRG